MANNTLNVRMQQKVDTSANWTSKNPVLLSGEIGFESDTKKFKVGDGSTAWKSLSYATVPLDDYVKKTSVASKGDNRTPVYFDANGNAIAVDGFTVKNPNTFSISSNNTSNIQPDENTATAPPWSKDLWHDHYAFMRYHTLYSQETTSDGTTWTTANKSLKTLFDQKELTNMVILTESEAAYRFTFKNISMAYSSLTWWEIAVGYTYPFSQFEVLIEHSDDTDAPITWKTCHKSTITGNSRPYYLKNGISIASDGFTRFTFTKKSNVTTGTVNLINIRALCTRKGSQGLGVEFEYPYDWDSDMNILPTGNNSKDLGSSSKKWRNVYATTFNGNATTATTATTATSATKATQDSDGNQINTTYLKKSNVTSKGSSTQPVYFDSNGNAVATDGSTIIGSLDEATAVPLDNNYFITNGNSSTTKYFKKPFSLLWEYIKDKISSVLGLTATSYSGSAAKVNNHTVNADVPSDAKFTDTTYSSKTAASGGTDVSLVTTGEKYTWNNKANKATTLSGYGITDAYTKTQTDSAISTKVATVVANAPEKFDTLKEIADWIDNDTTGAAKMANDISSLNTKVSAFKSAAKKEASEFAVSGTISGKDLNTITTVGFYNAGGGSGCTNVPDGTDAFGLQVTHNASGGYYTQIMFCANSTNANKVFKRDYNNGTWTAWQELKFTDTTYSEATQSKSGLMAKNDKVKLDNLPSEIKLSDIKPIMSKTYTDVIASSNSNGSGADFMPVEIKPKDANSIWKMHIRIKGELVYSGVTYEQYADITLYGTNTTYTSFYNYNNIRSTSYRSFYYGVYYRPSTAGNTAYYGFTLYNSYAPTDTNYKRKITVEVLEQDNCTISLHDSIANTDYTTYYKNMTARTTFDCCNNGLQETGDTTDSTTMQYYNFKPTAGGESGTVGIYGYNLIMMDNNGKYQSLTKAQSTATTKEIRTDVGFKPYEQIFYYSSSSNVNAGSTAGSGTCKINADSLNFKYASNCGSQLIAYQPIYLKGKIVNGLFYVDQSVYTQVLPTTEDGFVYMNIGSSYSTSNVTYNLVDMQWLWYKDGAIRPYIEVSGGADLDSYMSESVNSAISSGDIKEGDIFIIEDDFIDGDFKPELTTYTSKQAEELVKNGGLREGELFAISDDVNSVTENVPMMTLDEWKAWRNSPMYDPDKVVAVDDDMELIRDDVVGTMTAYSSSKVDKLMSDMNKTVSDVNDKVHNITISTSQPSGGTNGDIWIVYNA